jgi:hypothetical protein
MRGVSCRSLGTSTDWTVACSTVPMVAQMDVLCQDLLGAGNLGAFPLSIRRFESVAKFIVSMSMSHVIYMNNCTLAVIWRPPDPKQRPKPVEAQPTQKRGEEEIEASLGLAVCLLQIHVTSFSRSMGRETRIQLSPDGRCEAQKCVGRIRPMNSSCILLQKADQWTESEFCFCSMRTHSELLFKAIDLV